MADTYQNLKGEWMGDLVWDILDNINELMIKLSWIFKLKKKG